MHLAMCGCESAGVRHIWCKAEMEIQFNGWNKVFEDEPVILSSSHYHLAHLERDEANAKIRIKQKWINIMWTESKKNDKTS